MLAFIRALQTHFGLPPMEVDLEEGIQADAVLFRPYPDNLGGTGPD